LKEQHLSELSPSPAPTPRSMEFALFLTGGLWVLAARAAAEHAASGFVNGLHFEIYYEPLLTSVFLLFLLLVGFAGISWIATRSGSVRSVNALPARATARREWALGAVVGWAMVVVAVLPIVLTGDLHPNFWLAPAAFGHLLLEVAILLVLSLAQEAVYRGYLFARLIRAMGPTLATLAISAIAAAVSAIHPWAGPLSVFVTFLLSILFSMAYLRTRALWLPWGLHFAWSACIGVLFGLPVGGWSSFSSVVDTSTYGSTWITGGFYGPEGALFTVVVALAGMAVLYSLTRDLAWEYTQPVIVAAGYPMDVAPPAEHTKMEQAAPVLVQILATTPSEASTMPVIEQHLRGDGEREP
jgi:membrane protease YdiL (CAAX protease family)